MCSRSTTAAVPCPSTLSPISPATNDVRQLESNAAAAHPAHASTRLSSTLLHHLRAYAFECMNRSRGRC
jgi:hypothetical protein